MESFWLVPVPGRRIRDPLTQRPVAEGPAEYPKDSYWTRKRNDGDMEEVSPPEASVIPSAPDPEADFEREDAR